MHMLRTGLQAHLAFILYFQYRLGTAQITYQFFCLVKQPNTRNSVLQNTKFGKSRTIYRNQRTKTLREIRKKHNAEFTSRLHFRRFPAFPPTKALNRGLSRQNTAIYTKFFLNKPRPRLTVCTHWSRVRRESISENIKSNNLSYKQTFFLSNLGATRSEASAFISSGSVS